MIRFHRLAPARMSYPGRRVLAGIRQIIGTAEGSGQAVPDSGQ
jgi:hypothetical protein